jgi:hypothetical protein
VTSRLVWLPSILTLVLGVSEAGMGTARAESPSTSQCLITEIVNASGWTVPGLRGAKPRGETTMLQAVDVKDVAARALRPDSRVQDFPLVSCSTSLPGAAELRTQALVADSLVEYRRYGRVFGYWVKAPRLGSSKPRSHIGSVEMLYFYDPEGNGVFTVMRYAGTVGFVPFVPKWVRELERQQSNPE